MKLTLYPITILLLFFVRFAFGQTFTIVYGNDEIVHNCALVGLTDTSLLIEYNPILPGAPEERSLPINDLIAIRRYSTANAVAPCFALVGALVGFSAIGDFVDPASKETLGEIFLNIFETPIYWAAGACIGGGLGYLLGHYALGGNNDYIMLDGLDKDKIVAILKKLLPRSKRLWRFQKTG